MAQQPSCSSPSRLPPSVQMPRLRSVASKYCPCIACKERPNNKIECINNVDLSLSTDQMSNKESDLTKLERGFDAFFDKHLTAKKAKPCTYNRFKRDNGSRLNEVNNSQLMRIKYKFSKNFSRMGLSAGYEKLGAAFNKGVAHFITEIILMFVIVIVATVAVWIAFFQLMYKIATILHNSRNRHVKTLAIAFLALILLSTMSSVAYKAIKRRSTKIQSSYRQWKILPSSKLQMPNGIRHWFARSSWSSGKQTPTKNKVYLLWGGHSKIPGRSYKFWKSEDKEKPYFVFWRPPPKKSLGQRLTNVIFFWRAVQIPKRSWLGILASHDQYKQNVKRESWTSLLDFHKQPEPKRGFLQIRVQHMSNSCRSGLQRIQLYWRRFVQNIKRIWHKFYHKLQEVDRKRKWQQKCGCRSSYCFWTKRCPLHELQEEKRQCSKCRLKKTSISEQKRVRDLLVAHNRAKFYTMPMEMKSPPTLLTYIQNELRRMR